MFSGDGVVLPLICGLAKRRLQSAHTNRNPRLVRTGIGSSQADVSADLKGSQFSRFRDEPESLTVIAEHTDAAAAVEDKQSRLRVFSQPND
jgi:hypothetical protein